MNPSHMNVKGNLALLALCEGIHRTLTESNDGELSCFLWNAPEMVGQTTETPVIWDSGAHIVVLLE